MPSIDLHTIIQFVAKGSDVPGGDTPEYIAAQTFDMLGVPFIICLLAALIAGFCIFAFRNKISKNLKKILTVAVCAFAFCGILTSATQVFAQNANSEALPDKVIAYVDKQTGEITFDENTILKNTYEGTMQLRATSVTQTEAGEKVAGLATSNLTINGLNAQLYYGNPNGEDQPPAAGVSNLEPGDTSQISLGMSNISKEDALALIDKEALDVCFKFDVTYIITYKATSLDSGEAPAPQVKTQDVPATLSNEGTMVYVGYNFAGWNTKADGTGQAYASGGTYTDNKSITLYAQWTFADTDATVTYDANGGKFPPEAGGGGTFVKSGQKLGKNYVLPTAEEMPTYTTTDVNYDFVGWYTSATGGSEVTAETRIMETSTTVYAHWTPYYVVSFNLNGHGTGTYEDQKILPGQKATRPSVDPTDPDEVYVFVD